MIACGHLPASALRLLEKIPQRCSHLRSTIFCVRGAEARALARLAGSAQHTHCGCLLRLYSSQEPCEAKTAWPYKPHHSLSSTS